MEFQEDQIRVLKSQCSAVKHGQECGTEYLILEGLILPEEFDPPTCDALLCPTQRDGYPSRLFFDKILKTRQQRNWNANGIRILERNWYAFSWKVSRHNLSLAELLSAHIRGLL